MFIEKIENPYVVDLPTRSRAILGVPYEFIEDDVILSPTYLIQSASFINSKLSEYEEYKEEVNSYYIQISYIYYICYLLCSGMYARLPHQMENVNTKTVLQTIDWDKKALEYLDKANEMIDQAVEELLGEDSIGNSFATLSEETIYPNTTNM